MSDFKLTDKIDLSILNPYDVKLGNEFNDNLISTALSIIPKAYMMIGSELEITRAFYPKGRLEAEIGDKANAYERKYTYGLALTFKWKSFTENSAIRVAMDLFDELQEQGLHIIIDPYKLELQVYRKMKDRKVFIITSLDKKKKIIKS